MTSCRKEILVTAARLRVPYRFARRAAITGATVAWIAMAAFIALGPTSRSIFGPMKWADFPHFYALGAAAHAHRGDLLYDGRRLDALQRSLVPESAGDGFVPV